MSAARALPPYDGGCVSRMAHSRFLTRLCRTAGSRAWPRPTTAQLERHARRFGPEQVAETAAEHGLVVTVERSVRASVSGGPTIRQRVARLVEEGHDVNAVAEIEDLSPARARRLVEEVTP